MSDAESFFWLVVVILICVFWYIVISVAILCLLIWLYSVGWKKTFYGIVILIVLIPLSMLCIAEGPHLWREYQYKHSSEGIVAQKERSIIEMKQGLEIQLSTIVEIRRKYQNDINGFVSEIQEEKRKYSITSTAVATERMLYDIRLIRERDAYLVKLSEIEKVTRNGLEEVVYLLRQIDGTKGMTKIIGDGKSLSDNTENILQKYGSFAEPVAIKPSELVFKSPMVIWQQYVK